MRVIASGREGEDQKVRRVFQSDTSALWDCFGTDCFPGIENGINDTSSLESMTAVDPTRVLG